MYLKEKLCSQKNLRGSGCDSVGRAFSSNYGGPWFESSHRQKFTLNVYCQLYGKDENKEIEAEMGPILKKTEGEGSLYLLFILFGFSCFAYVE